MVNVADLILARDRAGQPIFQYFKSFSPAVRKNFASDEKAMDVTVEESEDSLTFVTKVFLRKSQRQIHPSRGNPAEIRCLPVEIKYGMRKDKTDEFVENI